MRLTLFQREVGEYIRSFQLRRNYSPSLHDLCVVFGWRSHNSAAKIINRLVEAGAIEKDPHGRIKFPVAPPQAPRPPTKLLLYDMGRPVPPSFPFPQ